MSKPWLVLLLFCASASAQTVNFGPVEPLTPSATTLATPSGRVALAYGAINASACTAAASAGATLTPANPLPTQGAVSASVSNTSTAAVTYAVTVTCTNATGSGSTTATITAPGVGPPPPPPPTGCPAIKSTTAGIASFTRLTGKVNTVDSKARTVDVTSFVSIYNYTGATLPWPSAYGIIAGINLPNANYLSEAFTIAAGTLPATEVFGDYTIGQTLYSAPISMSISTSCGDFSPPTVAGSTVVPGCLINLGTPGNNFFMQWTSQNSCKLVNGGAYFLNIVNADVSGVLPAGQGSAASSKNGQCIGSACTVPIQNGPGSW